MVKTRVRELAIMSLLIFIVGLGMIDFSYNMIDEYGKDTANLTGFTNYSGSRDFISLSERLKAQTTTTYTGIPLIDTLIVNVFVGAQVLFEIPDYMISLMNNMVSVFGIESPAIGLLSTIILLIVVFAMIELATRSEI